MANQYFPDTLVTPGEVLAEYLPPYDLIAGGHAPEIFAEISGVLSGRAVITPALAEYLAGLLRLPMHFWLNLERQYQEDKVRLGVDIV